MRQARFVLIDDIDGSTAQETVYFSVGRQQYEMDLNVEHLEQFNTEMEHWTRHARKISSRRVGRSTSSGISGANDAALIRSWAKDKGIALSERGRIPTSVRDQYYSETSKGE